MNNIIIDRLKEFCDTRYNYKKLYRAEIDWLEKIYKNPELAENQPDMHQVVCELLNKTDVDALTTDDYKNAYLILSKRFGISGYEIVTETMLVSFMNPYIRAFYHISMLGAIPTTIYK